MFLDSPIYPHVAVLDRHRFIIERGAPLNTKYIGTETIYVEIKELHNDRWEVVGLKRLLVYVYSAPFEIVQFLTRKHIPFWVRGHDGSEHSGTFYQMADLADVQELENL